jgi:hypothetical protein
MSDTLTTKQIDALVLDAVKRAGGVPAREIANMLRVQIYPNDDVKRHGCVRRSLQRMRKEGALFVETVWHFYDV